MSLIVGMQALLWLISGIYMVVVDLDFIHGDHLVRNMRDPLPADVSDLVPFSAIRSRFPQATEIALDSWMGAPHYRIRDPFGAHLVDATTGALRSPLSEADAIDVAQYHYRGEGEIASSKLLTEIAEVPNEVRGRALPLWQIEFNDFGSTSFYISAMQGDLVTRRHTFWRIFDFVWMLHIMDYESREDVNNTLFRVAAVLGLIMSLLGVWLLYFSFHKGRGTRGQTG